VHPSIYWGLAASHMVKFLENSMWVRQYLAVADCIFAADPRNLTA
jgi:hypothetical protein